MTKKCLPPFATLGLALFLALSFCGSLITAQTDISIVNWKSPVDGNWREGDKWDIRRPPCYDEEAAFPESSSPYDVVVKGTEAARALELSINSALILEEPGSVLYIGADGPDNEVPVCDKTIPTTPATEDIPNDGEQGGSSSMPTIIGAAAGGAVLLIVVVLVIFLVRRRGRKSDNGQVANIGMIGIVNNTFEVERERIKLADKLGAGAFGEVFKVFLRPSPANPSGGERVVAAKLLKAGAPYEEKTDFLSEIDLMKQLGPHPNVVSIVGHCLESEPFILLVELAEHGNLRDYLRAGRKSRTQPQLLHFSDFADFSLQIASGMSFLESNNVVHRDLACRNVLVAKNNNLKVSDFGLARDVEGEDYYRKQTNGRLPVKWMAPESLQDRVYTSKSDVWAFGVTMWEIFTLGASPYPTMKNHEVFHQLERGHRMSQPRHCNQAFYEIIMSCWRWEPDERPSFSELTRVIHAAQAKGNYTEPATNGVSVKEDIYEVIDLGDDTSGLKAAPSGKSAPGVSDWMTAEFAKNPLMESNLDRPGYETIERSDDIVYAGRENYDTIDRGDNALYQDVDSSLGTADDPYLVPSSGSNTGPITDDSPYLIPSSDPRDPHSDDDPYLMPSSADGSAAPAKRDKNSDGLSFGFGEQEC